MIPQIRRILVCTQLGPNSAYIFRWAFALARGLGARITVLHVVETLSPRQEAMVEGYAGQGTLHAAVQRAEREDAARLRRRVDDFCRRAVGEGTGDITIETVITEGDVTDEILRHVTSVGADVVVMGAHGRSSLVEMVLGSTAERVIQRCPVPVLTVQVPEGRQELTLID